MMRRQQILTVAVLVALCSVDHDLSTPITAQEPGRGRPFHAQLQPMAQSDVVALEASLTADERGGARVTFETKAVGETERLFWVVDTRTLRYRGFRLTDDSRRDAGRIRAFFRSAGVTLESDEALRQYLDGERQRTLERSSSRSPIARGQRGPEGVVPASLRGPVPGLDAHEPMGGPMAGDAEPEAQVTICDGNAFNKIEIWEPARRVANVGHLAETWTSTWWTGYPLPSATSSNMTHGCWSNPWTFIGTTWFTLACTPQLSRWNGGFLAVTSGDFLNYDFLFDLHAVRVFARAQVEHSGGTARLTTTYQYQTLGLWNVYEGWFLSSVSSGHAVESCYGGAPPRQEQMCYEIGGNWENGQCIIGNSPLIVDVNHDGFDLTDPEGGVWFDLDGDGTLERTAWTREGSDDAWLALDRNGNGVIDDGTELFGNASPLTADGRVKAANGFEALKALDGGSSPDSFDGIIDHRDSVFGKLLLWTDRNHNGVSEPEELMAVRDSRLLAIRTDYRVSARRDRHGNQFVQRGKAVWPEADRFVYDVWLRSR